MNIPFSQFWNTRNIVLTLQFDFFQTTLQLLLFEILPELKEFQKAAVEAEAAMEGASESSPKKHKRTKSYDKPALYMRFP